VFYWTMGNPIEETTIINRCKKEGSYENRSRNRTLPSNLKMKRFIAVINNTAFKEIFE
jgi:hypothetical protein